MMPRSIVLLTCVLCVCVGGSLAVSGQPHNLTFLFITSFGKFGQNISGVVPAANMALEDINSTPDILPGYILNYDKVRDSEVSQTIIIKDRGKDSSADD